MSPHFSLWGLGTPQLGSSHLLSLPQDRSRQRYSLKGTHSEGLKYLPGNFSHVTSGNVCQAPPPEHPPNPQPNTSSPLTLSSHGSINPRPQSVLCPLSHSAYFSSLCPQPGASDFGQVSVKYPGNVPEAMR